MAIILKGLERVEGLKSLSTATKSREAKRLLGYLLFELSALEKWEEVSDRIQKIKEKRDGIKDVPGMKQEPPPLEIEAIEKALIKIYEDCQTKYDKMTSLGRQRAPEWQHNTDEAPYQFLKHLMKKYADKLVSESGA